MMNKPPNVFCLNSTGKVTMAVNDGNEWVMDGEGHAAQKHHGDTVMLIDGKWHRLADQVESETIWSPINLANPSEYPLSHALMRMVESQQTPAEEQVYELIGPNINGNPDSLSHHKLIRLGDDLIEELNTESRNFHQIKHWLANNPHKSIVFHHPSEGMLEIPRETMA